MLLEILSQHMLVQLAFVAGLGALLAIWLVARSAKKADEQKHEQNMEIRLLDGQTSKMIDHKKPSSEY